MTAGRPDLFSRERLAGLDPHVMETSHVAVAGDGALAMNALLNLSLSGLGNLRTADPDVCEISNATRSPLMKLERLARGIVRPKAYEAALGFLANSYAKEPVVHAAWDRVERCGLGMFRGAGAIVAAVDRNSVRGWLSDAGMMLGIPFVEAGFHGQVGQLTVFRHDDPSGACWRCLNPEVSSGSASCSLYALGIQAEGRIPATQPVAALYGALVASAVLDILHGKFELASTMVTFDLARGTSKRISVDRNLSCPGPHRRLAEPFVLNTGANGHLGDLFVELETHGAEPTIIPPSPYILSLPCRSCGRTIAVGRPAHDVASAPECKLCSGDPPGSHGPRAYSHITSANLPKSMRIARLGLRSGALFEAMFADGNSRTFCLAGDPLESFRRFVRAPRSTSGPDDTNR